MVVVDLVAEFIAAYSQAAGKHFPYWLLGWNYLNPREDAHEIIMLNNGQFLRSLSALGYRFAPSLGDRYQAKENAVFSNYEGYATVVEFLRPLESCEPKFAAFPYQPKLCRRWWDSSHQRTCGNLSKEAIQCALDIDAQYERRRPTTTDESARLGRRWTRLVNLLRR
jgi:hypothetical protein